MQLFRHQYSFLIGHLSNIFCTDASYGSEKNCRYWEDKHPQHTGLVSYRRMFKEQSEKSQTDGRKVLIWVCSSKNYSIDFKRIRFHFHAYCQRIDTAGFVRNFKEYQAKKSSRLRTHSWSYPTKGGSLNDSFKSVLEASLRKRECIATPEIQEIYGHRKNNVVTGFEFMKACLVSFDTWFKE